MVPQHLRPSLAFPGTDNKPVGLQPRPYQTEATEIAVNFFLSKAKEHGIIILPTGSGKSVVIANIAARLEDAAIVFQPSKEILEQNFRKFMSYGYRAGVYSASAGMKHIDKVTFATIGSVAKKWRLFLRVRYIIVDECHLVNADGGMYQEFFHNINEERKKLGMEELKVLGLTATPYRLSSSMEGAMLKFLTRTRPAIFKKVLYYVQNDILFDAGYLAKLDYFSFNVVDRTMLQLNSSGTDFTDASVRAMYRRINMPKTCAYYANRLLAKRKNLLVFCSLIEEAQQTTHLIDGAVVLTGETDKTTRERILKDFTSGKIRCVVNVGVLTTGFDYPALECVLIARSTMSLALYYQIIGRVMRPYTYEDGTKKVGWVVDLGGNLPMFGKIETMKIDYDYKGNICITNNGRQLTNVTFTKN